MMLVRDELLTIRGALDSAIRSGCFEQILILLDRRAPGAMVRILDSYRRRYPGIDVLSYTWSEPPNFADARNTAISYMRCQYGFWLDADEKIVEPEAIRRLLMYPRGHAYNFYVVSPLPTGGTFDMYQPRLFPIAPGVKFEAEIFERLDWSLKRQGIPITGTASRAIFHVGYTGRVQNLSQKTSRNLACLRFWLARHTQNDEARAHMLQQYRSMTAGGKNVANAG